MSATAFLIIMIYIIPSKWRNYKNEEQWKFDINITTISPVVSISPQRLISWARRSEKAKRVWTKVLKLRLCWRNNFIAGRMNLFLLHARYQRQRKTRGWLVTIDIKYLFSSCSSQPHNYAFYNRELGLATVAKFVNRIDALRFSQN